ncbi:MAG: TonB-dependent receptor [Verrucomicrobiaceae bacterium]|nr:TonB-dependent receptor [Verrucomicrobiaceae bacterium]
MLGKHIQSALTIGLGVAAFSTGAQTALAQTQSAGLEEVFVTARKRDEGVQAVPIAVTALSAESLDQHNVKVIDDLNVTIPGFRFGVQGGRANNDTVIRGLSKIPFGDGVPATVIYFANVALPARGGNVGTYDLANIQVLKGPQGTLFGRNTIGGAVQLTPVAPTYEVNGYLRGNYGTANFRNLEGAINVPIIDEKVALRVTGQMQRQDGLNKNLSGGPDFNNTHNNSYRMSLLLDPTDKLENLTVYDHLESHETAAMGYLVHINPSLDMPGGLKDQFNAAGGPIPANAFGPGVPGTSFQGLGTQLSDQLHAQLAAAKAAGYHRGFTDLPNGGVATRKLEGVSNDTTFDMGWATLRNIFGYRSVKVYELITPGSNGPVQFTYPFAAAQGNFSPITLPFTVFDASQLLARSTVSDELQLYGNAWNDRLEWISGYYFHKDKPNGTNGTQFTAFGFAPSTPVTSQNTYYNWAVFGQTGLDISEWTVDGLKFNLGARYAVDKQRTCASPGTAVLTPGECDASVAAGAVGAGRAAIHEENYSYTVGLDWQITPDTLLYVTHRRGYRAGNLNTPIFNTFYTTGGKADGTGSTAPKLPGIPGCEVGGAVVDCPDLRSFQKTDPETVKDVEIGVKNDWNIGDVKGRINVAAFYMKYNNAVEFLNAQLAGIPSGVDPSSGSVGYNAADMSIKGLEFDLTVIPLPSLTLTLSGAFTDQDIDKIKTAANPGGIPGGVTSTGEKQIPEMAPNFTGTFGFNWMLPVKPLDGDLAFSGDYYQIGDFNGQGGTNEQLPGYHLVNFRLAWTGIANTKMDLAAYVKNATDEEYLAAPNVLVPGFPMATALPGESRTWGVEATYKF